MNSLARVGAATSCGTSILMTSNHYGLKGRTICATLSLIVVDLALYATLNKLQDKKVQSDNEYYRSGDKYYRKDNTPQMYLTTYFTTRGGWIGDFARLAGFALLYTLSGDPSALVAVPLSAFCSRYPSFGVAAGAFAATYFAFWGKLKEKVGVQNAVGVTVAAAALAGITSSICNFLINREPDDENEDISDTIKQITAEV
jgi:hypothetical protein